ncbi:hypothetical protein MTP99_010051 [Tenebrio molitor]|nr:hypothetical protein MTP99_010051 [Tenebrio molitor]
MSFRWKNGDVHDVTDLSAGLVFRKLDFGGKAPELMQMAWHALGHTRDGKSGVPRGSRIFFLRANFVRFESLHPDWKNWHHAIATTALPPSRPRFMACASRRLVSSFCVEVTENPITGTLCLTEVDLEIVDASFRLNAFEQCAKKWDELLGRPESSGRHKGLAWPLCTKFCAQEVNNSSTLTTIFGHFLIFFFVADCHGLIRVPARLKIWHQHLSIILVCTKERQVRGAPQTPRAEPYPVKPQLENSCVSRTLRKAASTLPLDRA